MALDFNIDPYYDDFDQTKNFHRILFRPGRAVQARELTQAQSILQDQVTKFADNIFKQNSPVSGGQITTNFNCNYVKLLPTYNNAPIDITQWYDGVTNNGLLVRNADGSVIARVIQTATATGIGDSGDPDTLILSYKTGDQFQDGDVIYDVDSNLAVQAIDTDATGLSSVASISDGVFYVLGNFVQITSSTTIVDKYDNTPSRRIGLNIDESIRDYIDDASTLDPAVGASNYQAPGADRYFIGLTLSSRPIEFGDDQNFVELVRVTDGEVQKLVDGSVYNVIDDYFAKRDFETNGDYVVNDFKLTPKTNADPDKYTLSVGKGLAYVHGYRTENSSPIELTSNRARSTSTSSNNPVFVDVGSYFLVDHVGGSTSTFFNMTAAQSVDIHCVPSANVNTTNAATYSATTVGSGYIRGLVYDYSVSDLDANTYVHKAYVHSISNQSPSANAVAGGSSTITFPGTYSTYTDAYVGVNISITTGPSAGDFRTITAYDGTTRVATVNQPWTVTPTTSSKFTLNFDIKDVESLVSVNNSLQKTGVASINANSGKIGGVSTGATILKNSKSSEMLFTVGSPYAESLTDSSYTTQQEFRNISFTSSGDGIAAQLSYESSSLGIIRHFGTPSTTLSSDLVKQNYTIIVTNKGSNSKFGNGDIINWVDTGLSVSLNADGSVATFTGTAGSGILPFTATIIAKVFVENADNTSLIRKTKTLITANTQLINTAGTNVNYWTYVDDAVDSLGQVYIQKSGLVGPGVKQSLYLSDVKEIVKIIDTGASGTLPISSMFNNASYDITNNYTFDNGQRDSIYDHASITLKPGAPQPSGNILVYVNYYQHSGGDGYFCVNSYLNEEYTQIPSYEASSGTLYQLRDTIDFRPARKNAQVAFDYRFSTTGTPNYGLILPVDLTVFTTDYSHYLGRRDKLVLSKDRTFQIIEGSPSLSPLAPAQPDGSLVVANLIHKPYTGFLPTEAPVGTIADLSIEKVKHKRYTMEDIAGLESRINQIEYYTSLSLLEQKASSLQIADTYGLNRFKNGILVDDFSSFSTADTLNSDYSATINRREHVMTATQDVKNFPLKSLASLRSLKNLDSSVNLGYKISSDGYVNYFTLPFTTSNVAVQKFASRDVNVNPFSVTNYQGFVSLSPNVDNWVDTKQAPSLLITSKDLQVYQSSDKVNVLTAGDWKTIPGTSVSTSVADSGGTTTTVTAKQTQTSLYGAYDSIGNTYALNNGYITDISILPYIRTQQIVVRGKNMLFNTSVNAYFDATNVNAYFQKANIIELTGVTGTFKEDDIIGYTTSSIFTPTGRVLGVQQLTTTSVRLYVSGDSFSSTYTNNGTLKSATFNASGTYVSSPASGTFSTSNHFSGKISLVSDSTTIRLSSLASSTDDYYVGNTIYINSGTGAGESATISAYVGSSRTVTLSTGITTSTSSLYSLGGIKSDETGAVYGVFNLPGNTFHNGQRVFRFDNSVNQNVGSSTTFSEGTFYSEGLQTTQQRIDFGASPAGAKNTFYVTSAPKTNVLSSVYTANPPPPSDPVAQTFIVSKDNYPNGLFLDSIKIFFRTKPTSDNSPITLSIVGTLNGYPTGETLDHSIATLTPDKIKVSETPQYLDSTTATEFKFDVPIYIQPSVLYAFILKSNSKQYTMWSAANGDTALKSSTKNAASDSTPAVATKIAAAPYVGALFLSQNAQTWTTDQNQSLMFVIDRCVFDTTTTPTIAYSIPKKLPQRTMFNQSLLYFANANNVSNTIDSYSNTDVIVDAFNITTTDFVPTATDISYTYRATLSTGADAGTTHINPGKFGTPTQDDIYLTDGKGERVLLANTDTSFALNAVLTTGDNAVSPIISDAGLTTFAIKWNINNCELSNSLITLANGGSNYNVETTSISVSAPTGLNGSQAYASANVVGGVIDAVYITYPGSGYVETPTFTITDGTGDHAEVVVAGETSKSGGNALARYVSKKVTLDQGFDSGDLNVYLTAYRPPNTDISVYYKVLNRNDTQKFEDGSWQLMTPINSSGTKYSNDRNDYIEYSFAPGSNGVDQGYVSYTSSTTSQVYTTFSQFAIKVVLRTTDATFVPVVSDIRAIALPPNVNTTF